MPIEFDCPHCHIRLRTPDEKAGLSAFCPHCNEPITIPQSSRSPEEDFDREDHWQGEGHWQVDVWNEESVGPAAPGSAQSSADMPQGSEFSHLASSKRHCYACGSQVPSTADRCPMCEEPLEDGPHQPQVVVVGTSSLAIASLIFGVFSLLAICVWPLSVPIGLLAVILGILAVVQINRGTAIGMGWALFGILFAAVPLAFWTLIFVAIFAVVWVHGLH